MNNQKSEAENGERQRALSPATCSAKAWRAVSLWQPWASAMGSGVKQNETRSWPTSYRGELVICSAKRKPSREEVGDGETYDVAMRMPYGCAICVVEIYDCRGVEWVSSQPNFTEAERDLGDYTPGMGRYAWMTRNCRTLTTPLPIVGRQGLWILTPETIAAIKALLPNIRS
jgi:hypothetical protein